MAKRGARRTALVLILSTCSAIGLAASLSWQRVHAQRPVTRVRSIAVLPMGNFSDDVAHEHFADGMTEELISELSRIDGLKVVSRTSVMGYKGTKKHLPEIARQADILIAAIGKPRFVTADMVKPGATVIDVGINRVEGKLCGDVDFDAVRQVAGAITPVPGGVGPLTIAMLLENTLKAAVSQSKI